MGSISRGRRAFAAAGRRAVLVVRLIFCTLLEAALFAAAVALLVWLLPGKLPVALLSLYGFIGVGLLQLGAAAILVLTLLRAPFSADARRDVVKALSICGGFLIVVALLNTYILALAQMWGRDFGLSVHHIALSGFLTIDDRVIAGIASAGASVAAFIDRIVIALLHPSHPPLHMFFAGIGTQICQAMRAATGAMPSKLAAAMGYGAASGLVLSLWLRLARGPRNG